MTSYVDPKVASAVLDKLTDYGYIGAADTAKLIRSALKLAFPGVPFSVTSKNYSGGSRVDVRWTDGPNKDKVDMALSGFVGKGFDGMIDMAYSSKCYMTRAGGIGFARTSGTVGSHGSVPDATGDVPFGATLVSFYSYIMASRTRTDPRPDWNDYWANRDFDAADLPPAPVSRY